MIDPFEPNPLPSLTPADAAALDGLVESGFDPSQAAGEARSARMYALLAGLDSPVAEGAPELGADSAIDRHRARLLMDVTMARVLRSRETGLVGRIAPEGGAEDALSASDGESLDAMVASGWRSQDKTAGVGGLLALLDGGAQPTSEQRSALIEATLGRVQRSIDTQRGRLRLANDAASVGAARPRVRLADLGAIAAIILVGFSVLSPIVTGSREGVREQLCAANLSRAGMGFSLFGADNDNRLPKTSGEQANVSMPWWNVGKGPSHSANLYVLVRNGYVMMSDLACPGNSQAPTVVWSATATDWRKPEEVSYSYQLFGATPPRLSLDGRMLVLSDKSPVVERARRGESFNALAPSHNHSGRGQNVLFSDGSVDFLHSPTLANGDNIWTPRSADGSPRSTLTGREAPFSRDDAFVGP